MNFRTHRIPNMSRRDWLRLAAGAPLLGTASGLVAAEIPAHPSQLKYAPLRFDPPKAADYRFELPHGAIAFLVEDHEFPLIDISLTIRTGEYLEDPDKTGLFAMTGGQMRSGGSKTLSAREFDEQAAFLATEIGSGIGDTSASASMGCLTRNLDASLKLFFDMLKNPGFDAQRLELAVAQILQGMERRNDQTQAIERREFGRLMRGDSHYSTRQSTKASIEAITREAMMEVHERYYHPSAFIFAVAGDFDSKEMVARLGEALISGWPGGVESVPKVPAPGHTPKPGVYMVDKSEVNQSRISMGHLGVTRDNPDHIALDIMNEILGGGGFTSRIMTRVRSDEGLAYSAGSSFPAGTYYPGVFSAAFQSKNPTCARATAIVLEEIERMRNEKVSSQELETAKNYNIEIFPRFFATARGIAGTFAGDEYTNREKDYWEKYRDRIAAVDADTVLRVAQKYLMPKKLAILAVGSVKQMLAGDPDHAAFKFEKFDGDGTIEQIPLPDPLTMKYPEG